MAKYIMALDSGTTSNRTIIFDSEGRIVSMAQKPFTQHFPEPGLVEHDANEIWETQLLTAREALEKANLTAFDIAGIGITNQRETTVLWDKKTGEPVSNAIVWQDRRTAPFCDALLAEGLEEPYRLKTGLIIDPYFSGTKIRWILENIPGARERAENGELLFGTIETFLIWRLTGGRVHVTDYTNASRTMLFNINTLTWDEEILSRLDIPRSLLPEVKPSSCIYGETDPEIFGAPVKVAGAAGDQQSALFGQACFTPGEVKNTYGTGCFLLMNIGEKPVFSKNGLVTTLACSIGDKVNYALEGSVFVAGSAVQWLREEVRLITSSAETEAIAAGVPDTAGCYVVPAFTGLGAPYWDPYARGAIVGLTRGTSREHLIRATLESLAYQTADVLQAMEQDTGNPIRTLKADGGAAANNFLMQFQADILNAEVIRPSCVETTAMGAAFLAGLAVGLFRDMDEICSKWQFGRSFSPVMEEDIRKKKLRGWKRAVERAKAWAKEDEEDQ